MKKDETCYIDECLNLYYKHKNCVTISALAQEVHLSESSVNRRIQKAKQVLTDNYSGILCEKMLINLVVIKPSEFYPYVNLLQNITSIKLLNLTLALFETWKVEKIAYSEISKIVPQLKNKDRINKTIDELRNFKIYDSYCKKDIYMYEKIYYEKTNLKYKFSDEILYLIDKYIY